LKYNILELDKSYKEKLLRKNEIEYATKKPGIGEEYYAENLIAITGYILIINI